MKYITFDMPVDPSLYGFASYSIMQAQAAAENNAVSVMETSN